MMLVPASLGVYSLTLDVYTSSVFHMHESHPPEWHAKDLVILSCNLAIAQQSMLL